MPDKLNFKTPNVAKMNPPVIKDQNSASEILRKLEVNIQTFEGVLTDLEEVAFKLVSFGKSETIIVHSIEYWNPNLIVFIGVNQKGQKVQLIQHVSQLSFLLVATPVKDPIKNRRRIGFESISDTENV